MAERRECWDRRREPRYPTVGRIAWKKEGGKTTFRGWLSDTSRSSASFVAGTAHQPSLGERIELVQPGDFRQRCRVTRLASYNDDLSLVACTASSTAPDEGRGAVDARRRHK
jgi:hypothetical protein